MEETIDYKFKKVDGTRVPDVVSYVCDFLRKHEGARVIVGCDSIEMKYLVGKYKGKTQRELNTTTVTKITYAVVIAMYYPEHKGAHLITCRFKRERNGLIHLFDRLWIEVESAREVAEMLENGLIANDVQVDRKLNKNFIEIHLDANEDPKFKSNVILNASVGYLNSLGFIVEYKPDAWVASYAADFLCRK